MERADEREAGDSGAERGELADDVEVLFDEVGVGWLGVVGIVEEVTAAGLELSNCCQKVFPKTVWCLSSPYSRLAWLPISCIGVRWRRDLPCRKGIHRQDSESTGPCRL